MPDPDTRSADNDDDATNRGQSAQEPAEGADNAPGPDAGSPEG